MGTAKTQDRKPKPKRIIRASHSDQSYFLMLRSTAQDERLSWSARGMLTYLLSKPDDWVIDVNDLKQNCGRDKVYAILNELIQYRYMAREKVIGDKQRIESVDYYVYESPLPEKPDAAEPDTEKPDTEKPDVYIIQNQHSTENTLVAKKSPRTRARKPKAVPQEKKPRTPQPVDPLFDAIGKHILDATTPEAIEACNWRIGQILYGDKKRIQTGLIDYEAKRQAVDIPSLDYVKLASDVGVFMRNYKKNHPDGDLKDCVKVLEWWVKFRSAQDKITAAADNGSAWFDDKESVWFRKVNGKLERMEPGGAWESAA